MPMAQTYWTLKDVKKLGIFVSVSEVYAQLWRCELRLGSNFSGTKGLIFNAAMWGETRGRAYLIRQRGMLIPKEILWHSNLE